jgi:hypothetical protein
MTAIGPRLKNRCVATFRPVIGVLRTRLARCEPFSLICLQQRASGRTSETSVHHRVGMRRARISRPFWCRTTVTTFPRTSRCHCPQARFIRGALRRKWPSSASRGFLRQGSNTVEERTAAHSSATGGISSGRRFPPSAASCLRSPARPRYRRGRSVVARTCARKFSDVESRVWRRQPFVSLLYGASALRRPRQATSQRVPARYGESLRPC